MMQISRISFGSEENAAPKRITRAELQQRRKEQYALAKQLDAKSDALKGLKKKAEPLPNWLIRMIAEFQAEKSQEKPLTGYAAGVAKNIAKFHSRKI